eukprot:TRINITY_DN8677_c0_g1_i2.p1 TRINITY_DN8677_c0_g1~~TRINITY_DN8677_c0_g1_i2.p1  ORF type:complete len:263 (-),score=60.70 TRINITY_DN8677_c0_g1_i2:4-792(-)
MEVIELQSPPSSPFPPPPFPSPPRAYHRYQRRHEPTIEEFGGKKWKFFAYTAYNLILSFLHLIFSAHNIITMALGIGGTILCHKLSLYSDMPISLISAGLFFPVSFGISFSFGRNENMLVNLADMKSSMVDLFYCCREFQKPGTQVDVRCKEICQKLLRKIAEYAMHKGTTVEEIYNLFEEMSWLLEELRRQDDWIRSVISRAYQYRRYILNDFERIRIVHDYRNASTLRAYGMVFTTVMPILFSPYFAKICKDYSVWFASL